MVQIDCVACGVRLEIPASIGENGEFVCPRCELLMLNSEAIRHFRWGDLDPYVRRYGASRRRLWGGAVGSTLWLPLLAAVLYAKNQFDPLFMMALALPYVALVVWLLRRRPRAPAFLWKMRLYMLMGAYLLYASALFGTFPGFGAIFWSGQRGVLPGIAVIGALGFVTLVIGGLGFSAYLRRARRSPRARLALQDRHSR